MVVGVTGGIGSGKTFVCQVFETLGVPVYYADDRAKALYHESESLKSAVLSLFGDEAYRDGLLNRAYLAERVFSDESLLKQLNALVHPLVAEDFDRWLAEQTAPYVVKEAAIMIESGAYKQVDELVVVDAPEDVRIERVMKRDGVDEKNVRARISKQLSSEERAKFANYLIINDGAKPLIPQVIEVDKELRKKMNFFSWIPCSQKK